MSAPNANQLHQLTRRVTHIARAAGTVILEHYDSHYDVTTKPDESPVTSADLAADKLIALALQALDFKAPVLSEESTQIPFSQRADWDTYWLVDPLDGTREFIKGNGEFSVNIALIHAGQPVLGVVYAPVTETLYFAYRAGGAWKQCAGAEKADAIHARQVPATGPTVARSRSRYTGPQLRMFLDNIGQYEEIALGSALKSCLVAEGQADIYPRLGPTSEWDTGAAQCIVTEAGGHFTDTRMCPLRYNTKESLINPDFFVWGAGDTDWSMFLGDEYESTQ